MPVVRLAGGVAGSGPSLALRGLRPARLGHRGHDLPRHPDATDGLVLRGWHLTSGKGGVSATELQRDAARLISDRLGCCTATGRSWCAQDGTGSPAMWRSMRHFWAALNQAYLDAVRWARCCSSPLRARLRGSTCSPYPPPADPTDPEVARTTPKTVKPLVNRGFTRHTARNFGLKGKAIAIAGRILRAWSACFRCSEFKTSMNEHPRWAGPLGVTLARPR